MTGEVLQAPALSLEPFVPVPAPAAAQDRIAPAADLAPAVTIEGNKLVVSTSALKGVITCVVTGLLRVVGGILIASGFISASTANAAILPVSQAIAGTLMATAAQAWAMYREKHKHDRIVEAANTAAANIVFR